MMGKVVKTPLDKQIVPYIKNLKGIISQLWPLHGLMSQLCAYK